jgi:hypothetical protein
MEMLYAEFGCQLVYLVVALRTCSLMQVFTDPKSSRLLAVNIERQADEAPGPSSQCQSREARSIPRPEDIIEINDSDE